jgi:hypothetical protein
MEAAAKGGGDAMTLDELLALLPDNATGQISAANMRTIVTELYNDANPPYVNVVNQGPAALVANAAWTVVPGTAPYAFTLAEAQDVEFVVSLNIDTMAANNQVQVGLDLTGATVSAVGSKPEQVLWVGGKQPVQATLEVTFIQRLNAGTTSLLLKYTAQANATLTAMAAIAAVISNQ